MFRIRTFGGLAIEHDGVVLDDLGAQRKTLALMAVIAASESGGVSRDSLLALLWSDSDTERARGALNQSLHVLRRRLGSSALLGTAELRLNPDLIESDVASFRKAHVASDFDTAVGLFTGDFLAGVHLENASEFEHWLDERRNELNRKYRTALEHLARAADSRNEHAAAAVWWQHLQTAEPLNSRVAVALISALAAAGDRAGALQHARAHEARLRAELDIPPDPAVTRLVEQIQAQRFDSGLHAAAPRSPAVEPGAPNPPAAEPPISRPVRTRRRIAVIAATVALVLLTSVLALWRLAAAVTLDADRIIIAVLENRTGQDALAPIGYMAADWITRGVTLIPGITVMDAGAAYAQGQRPSGELSAARQLARRYGAGLVVAGSYYRRADSLYYSATIIDAEHGRVVRALDPIAGPLSDPLPAIDELRQRITAGVASLLDASGAFFTRNSAQVPRYEAYQQFVAAQNVYWSGRFEDAIPGLRRTIELDPSFLAAAVRLATVAVGIARCELADSVHHALESRAALLTEIERLTIGLNNARCDLDWEEALRLHHRRAELQPNAPMPQWTMAATARRANRPAEALAALRPIDPDRDLGWMPAGKVFYWREYTAALHMLGDYSGELRIANQAARLNPNRLSSVYHRARSLAGAERADDVVRALAGVETLPPDPALVSGEVAGRSRPERIATAGWVLYQIATELRAHGHTKPAQRIAERAVQWYETRPATESALAETRIAHASALILAGRYDDADALLQPLARADTVTIAYHGLLGVIAAYRGDRLTADTIDAWLAARPPRRPPGEAHLFRTRMAAVRGNRAHALDLLEALPHRVHPTDFALFHSDPDLEAIREEPRFVAFIRPRG